MANLTVSDERVRKAAETCPDAKRVLAELFPEAFVAATVIPKGYSCIELMTTDGKGVSRPSSIQIRTGYEYANKGFYLPKAFGNRAIKWKIVVDSQGENVLLGEVSS